MNNFEILLDKIKKKEAKLCIIGLGYVGLPLAVAFSRAGYFVYGFDTNQKHIERLKKAKPYILDVDPKEVLELIKNNKFYPTIDEKILTKVDVIIICVPTPLRKVKTPDVSYIILAAKTIKKYLRSPQLIILESTSYPGTTREVLLPILKKSGLKEEQDFFVCFSPERVNPGDKKFPLTKIPKIVGGLSENSSYLAKELYKKIIKNVFCVSCSEVAETAKLLENTFRLVNIALANEFAILANKLNINIWEVIEAAKTKPFGFMPFYPGPGLGGHCLDGKEIVVIKNTEGIELIEISSFYKKLTSEPTSIIKRINGVEYVKPLKNYRMLTFDLNKKRAVFKPVTILSRRIIKNNLFRIITNDNRKIEITEAHPMLVYSKGKLNIKFAKDLNIGDRLPFVLDNGYSRQLQTKEFLKIDLIEKLKENKELVKKIRIRHKKFLWKDFKKKIYQIDFNYPYYFDYIRNNFLPLKYFLLAEEKKLLEIPHKELLLCSGKGFSCTQIPAVINITPSFCRLIGYYLSEGCITKDKSMRVRFSFNKDEKEYIKDLCKILKNIGLKYSVHFPKDQKTVQIKVSSNIFGVLLKDILKCGTNSYNMNIPSRFFNLPKRYKWELLKGIFRGDAGVDIKLGRRHYTKNSKEYCHFNNTIGINYFSASKSLFSAIVFLLQDFGIVPTFKKREGLLYILSYEQAKKLKDVFLGEKRKKIEDYFSNSRKKITPRRFTNHNKFITTCIKSIQKVKGNYVYSAETKDTHTIVTSYGLIVHNCIPVDPLYLAWKAKKVGFKTKMIDLASELNRYMPNYVVERMEKALLEKKIRLEDAKILIVGVTYKKDVKDLRESPALEIIELLNKKAKRVDFFDPLIPYLKINNIDQKGIKLNEKKLKMYNCVIIVTDHSNIDYNFLRENSKFIFDTRNVYKKNYPNVIRL